MNEVCPDRTTFHHCPAQRLRGTELFIGHLAEGVKKRSVEVLVYTNGESTVKVERRWTYEHAQWPIKSDQEACLRELDHTSWGLQDAAVQSCYIVHPNSRCHRLSLASPIFQPYAPCTVRMIPS